MSLTEQQLNNWHAPASKTEDEKCQNAISQITQAIRNRFSQSQVSIFLQGSYRNNTNVRMDSDVDIVARYNDVFFPDTSFLNGDQKRIYEANRIPATYMFADYKRDLLQILKDTFGTSVRRKNKCLFVGGNNYRVNADVVPCFPRKRFETATTTSAEGIEFVSDDGKNISSFPEQHYTNGVTKNLVTGRMYKRMVRIVKRIRNELISSGTITKELASSFFIECLVYNVPTNLLCSSDYRGTLRNVIVTIYNDVLDVSKFNEYVEVSELRWLFRGSSRSQLDVKNFMQYCWDYAGLN